MFAGIQTFGSGSSAQAPINVTLALDPAAGLNKPLATRSTGSADERRCPLRAAGEPALQLAALELDARTTFTGAFKDVSSGRYAYRDLFDGRPETFVTIEAPENEINVLVDLGSVQMVGGIEYTPPAEAGIWRLRRFST